MRFVCLLYENENIWESLSESESESIMVEHSEFTAKLVENNQLHAGEALQPVATAKSVRIRNGEVLTTDGPFAETKEQLGGFYLIEADDENQAVQIASRIPSVRYGCVEVRPVIDFSE